ncbi:MAG TPA: DUF4129 domain-containing protein, partial [Stellaceae bacterium]|nr:DUF4129 domain-containing protein [Stellaceae bacterium]
TGGPIEGLPSRVSVPLPDWLIVTVVAALSVASLVFIVIVLPRPRPRRKKGENDYQMYYEPRKVPPLLGVLLLLLALTPGAMLGGTIYWMGRSNVSVILRAGGIITGVPSRPTPAPAVQAPQERPVRQASPVTGGLIGAVAVLIGVGSLAFVLWLRFGDWLPRLPGDFAPVHAPLAEAVEISLDDLRREPDARLAIIRIYQNFERALAVASFPRRRWETPIEFMRAALGRLPLPAAAAHSLTGLFEIARFSRHPVGGAERERAWQSLIEIRDVLDKRRREPDGSPS